MYAPERSEGEGACCFFVDYTVSLLCNLTFEDAQRMLGVPSAWPGRVGVTTAGGALSSPNVLF